MTHPDPLPPEPAYGVPSPDLVARAQAGYARFLDANTAADADQEHDGEPESAG
ncbi:hypothetical protein GCM10010497_58560 [Streptomyces cinereoruber]|uniref:Uncharacterized protein n=1 Tax=Streptomyces cinereoruber TaxID=67260 RepID=A0AAV4KRJ0_9ACTN|nr:hypothetical protein [Streptomyces cinereoruber]MBB4161794.1 hypothetical protein [Streptomyces cinereoruber]NIH65479.1 hypothetical protein [Streptomyces cinereoruber]GGR47481.1 hypothetical protein GCM10010497_58560 [Streptomyces cinereoruber]